MTKSTLNPLMSPPPPPPGWRHSICLFGGTHREKIKLCSDLLAPDQILLSHLCGCCSQRTLMNFSNFILGRQELPLCIIYKIGSMWNCTENISLWNSEKVCVSVCSSLEIRHRGLRRFKSDNVYKKVPSLSSIKYHPTHPCSPSVIGIAEPVLYKIFGSFFKNLFLLKTISGSPSMWKVFARYDDSFS